MDHLLILLSSVFLLSHGSSATPTSNPAPLASSQDRFLFLPFQQQNSSPRDVLP